MLDHQIRSRERDANVWTARHALLIWRETKQDTEINMEVLELCDSGDWMINNGENARKVRHASTKVSLEKCDVARSANRPETVAIVALQSIPVQLYCIFDNGYTYSQ